MKLNERQRMFCDFYIESLNIYESAIKAGYSENYAKSRSCELLDNVGIKAYIDERLTEVKSNRIATIQDILEFHTKVMNNEYKELGYNKPLYLKDRQVSAEALIKRLELMENKGTDDSIKIKIVKASEKDE